MGTFERASLGAPFLLHHPTLGPLERLVWSIIDVERGGGGGGGGGDGGGRFQI